MSNELQGHQDRILRGPMWSGCPPGDVNNPLKAQVNVASVGSATLQRRSSASADYTTTSIIQVANAYERNCKQWYELCDN